MGGAHGAAKLRRRATADSPPVRRAGRFTGCHYAFPHLLTSTALQVRFAARPAIVTIPLAAVSSVGSRERSHHGSRSVRLDEESGALVIAVGGRTNLDLRLREPVEATVRGRVQEVREVRILTDEAREASHELRRRTESGASRTS